jgi:hypothetical protein
MSYSPDFLKPNLASGRPEQREGFSLKIDNFMPGVDTFFDSMVSNSSCRIAFNNTSYGRTLDIAKGFEQWGTAGGAGSVLMMSSLQKFNSNDVMYRIIPSGAGVQLQKWTTSWANVGSVFGNTSSRVHFSSANTVIGGEERLYMANGVNELRYITDSGITTVTDPDTAEVTRPKFVTAVENVIVIANFASVHGKNDLIYSKAGTQQFRRDVDLTLADTSNKISFDAEITGLATLGWLVYVFTAGDGLWELDLNTGIPRVITTHGTVSPKSIATGSDMMIWADQYGVWGLALGGQVTRLSDPIEGLYKELSANNLFDLNAIITNDGLYQLWIGDITFEGEVLSNVVLVYDIENSRMFGNKIWRVLTGKASSCWCNWTNSFGFTNTFWGARDTLTTYIDQVDNDYNGVNIITDWRSKDFVLADDREEITLQYMYFKIRPDNAQDVDMQIYVRVDLGDWQDMGILTIPANATNDLVRLRKEPLRGVVGSTFAVRLVFNTNTGMKLYELNCLYNKGDSNINLD